MRIAGFVRLWHTHRNVGGMQGHALNLYSGLVKMGHEVEVFTTFHPEKANREIDNGIVVNYIQNCEPVINSKQYNDNSAKLLWDLHKKKKFDIIHSESDGAKGVLQQALPVIATWHGVSYCGLRSKLIIASLSTEKESHIAALQQNIVNLVKEIEYFKNFNGHIAISDKAYKDLNEIYGIPETKLFQVYNGFDTRIFSVDESKRRTIRQKHQIPNNAIVLGVVGRLTTDKGHPLFQKILPNILEKYKNVYVMVVGEGDHLKSYKNLNCSRVIIVGPQPYNEMSGYYNSFDVFVNPTLRYLGLDMTLQEAALCGTPILASNVGSIYESVIKHEKTCNCFTINNIDSFEAQLIKMIKRGPVETKTKEVSDHAKKGFSIETMCSEYVKAFAIIQESFIRGKR